MRRLLLLPAALLGAACLAACSGGDGDEAQTVTRVETVEAAQAGNAGPEGAESFDRIPDIVADVAPSVVAVQTDSGEGSGVIWSADGVVVTNDHVAAGANQVRVIFRTGREAEADVVASDPRSDLAVLRVGAGSLPAATFAKTIPEIGELAVAIGNPLGFENTASAGIVSGVSRRSPRAGRRPRS